MPTSSAAFSAPATTAVVTWKPQLSAVLGRAGRATGVRFQQDSRRDHRSDGGQHRRLKANPKLGKALVGAWYEDAGADVQERRRRPGGAGGDGQGIRHRLAGFDAQLATTHIFRDAGRGLCLRDGGRRRQDHGSGAQVLLRHGILGQGAASADAVGIQFPGGQDAWATPTMSRCASIRGTPRWPWTASCEPDLMRRLINQQPGGAGRSC